MWLHNIQENPSSTHLSRAIRRCQHTWFLFVCSMDLKDIRSWSICAKMCACVCEHFAIHFHLNCPFGFRVAGFCCCFEFSFLSDFFFRFFFFANEVDVDNDFSMYWSALYTTHNFPRVFSFSLHRSLRFVDGNVNAKPHRVWSVVITISDSLCIAYSPILYVRLWLSSPKWFPLFFFLTLVFCRHFPLVYLGEMNWNPLHIWRVFRGYFCAKMPWRECFVFDDFFFQFNSYAFVDCANGNSLAGRHHSDINSTYSVCT